MLSSTSTSTAFRIQAISTWLSLEFSYSIDSTGYFACSVPSLVNTFSWGSSVSTKIGCSSSNKSTSSDFAEAFLSLQSEEASGFVYFLLLSLFQKFGHSSIISAFPLFVIQHWMFWTNITAAVASNPTAVERVIFIAKCIIFVKTCCNTIAQPPASTNLTLTSSSPQQSLRSPSSGPSLEPSSLPMTSTLSESTAMPPSSQQPSLEALSAVPST